MLGLCNVNSSLCRNLLTCKEPDCALLVKRRDWKFDFASSTRLVLAAVCPCLAHQSDLVTQVPRLETQSDFTACGWIGTAACKNLLFVPFPSQIPCLCHPIFRDVCPLIFVPQTNDHKGQSQVILRCSSVLSKVPFFYVLHPFHPQTVDPKDLWGNIKRQVQVQGVRVHNPVEKIVNNKKIQMKSNKLISVNIWILILSLNKSKEQGMFKGIIHPCSSQGFLTHRSADCPSPGTLPKSVILHCKHQLSFFVSPSPPFTFFAHKARTGTSWAVSFSLP